MGEIGVGMVTDIYFHLLPISFVVADGSPRTLVSDRAIAAGDLVHLRGGVLRDGWEGWLSRTTVCADDPSDARIQYGSQGTHYFVFRLLQPGQYTLDVGCGAGTDADNTWDRVLNVAVLEISNPPEHEVVHGLVRLPYEIAVARG